MIWVGQKSLRTSLRAWRRVAVFAMVVSLWSVGASAQTNFSVDVRLVPLLVTVKNAGGASVGGLDRKDSTVYDRGVRQDIAVFERQTELPLSIAVLLDVSGSTGRELRYEISSVGGFMRALVRSGNSKDAASLYTFNDSVTLATRFTRSESRLEASLATLKPEGGTSLYDAIYLAAEGLRDREGRHVVVVITDGGDTTSRKDYRQALEAAQLADAVIYPILVVPITNDAGRNLGGERALESLAASTGGRVFAPNVGVELDRVFGDILTGLRTQYLIAYYPRNLPKENDTFHPVRVEVSRSELQVRTRAGYYANTR
jgi:Ca-activated chloride channel family protein